MSGNILGVDRGTKYVGLAHRNERSNITMPIGYLMNDKTLLFNIADVLQRYRINTIVIGYPKQHKETQKLIDGFLEQIGFIDPDLVVIKADEEYTSVQAGATSGNYVKNEAEDTLAAMHILEGYLEAEKSRE